MNRRSFLQGLLALPVLGFLGDKLKPAPGLTITSVPSIATHVQPMAYVQTPYVDFAPPAILFWDEARQEVVEIGVDPLPGTTSFDAGVPALEKVGICDQCKEAIRSVNGRIHYLMNAAGFLICPDCAAKGPPRYSYTFQVQFPKGGLNESKTDLAK